MMSVVNELRNLNLTEQQVNIVQELCYKSFQLGRNEQMLKENACTLEDAINFLIDTIKNQKEKRT